MDPFRTDPFSPFPVDPRGDVLSLQSYPLGEEQVSADCPSQQSIVIICDSSVSGIQGPAIPPSDQSAGV